MWLYSYMQKCRPRAYVSICCTLAAWKHQSASCQMATFSSWSSVLWDDECWYSRLELAHLFSGSQVRDGPGVEGFTTTCFLRLPRQTSQRPSAHVGSWPCSVSSLCPCSHSPLPFHVAGNIVFIKHSSDHDAAWKARKHAGDTTLIRMPSWPWLLSLAGRQHHLESGLTF